MKTVPEELFEFATKDSILQGYLNNYTHFNDDLKRFLFATMDEVRIWRAYEVTRNVLSIIDFDDAEYFREGVLKREATGTITYQSQRDHSTHTLYNWLLGWYFYTKCSTIRDKLDKQIKIRGWPNGGFGIEEYFGHI